MSLWKLELNAIESSRMAFDIDETVTGQYNGRRHHCDGIC